MKQTLIMVPGFMCDEQLFAPQIEGLSESCDVRVICPAADVSNMEDMANSILRLAPSSFAIFGLSMGGIIAMEIAKLAPGRITHLALSDCNPYADTDEQTAERLDQINSIEAGQLSVIMKNKHISRYFSAESLHQKFENICLKMAERLGPKVFVNHTHSLINRPNQCESLKKIDTPTLIVCGAQDQVCPLTNHLLMNNLIPNSHLEIIPNSGHLPTLEQPEYLSKVIKNWLLK